MGIFRFRFALHAQLLVAFSTPSFLLFQVACGQLQHWYYDTSSAPGLGGSPPPGMWEHNAGGAMWTQDATGSSTPVVTSWDSTTEKNVIFDGIPATIQVTYQGDNEYAAGLEFRASGYMISSPNAGGLLLHKGEVINVVSAGHTATISAPLQSTNGLDKRGDGTLVLSGTNPYSGTTRINGGTLSGVMFAPPGSASSFGTGDIAISNGSTLEYTGATVGVDRTISLGTGGGRISVTNGGTILPLNQPVSGTSLAKAGIGVLRFDAAMTYTGSTTVEAGTLRLNSSDRVPDASALTVASGATFDLGGFNETVGSLSGAGAVSNIGTLTTGGNNSSTVYSGSITGSGGLTKKGTGTFTLSSASFYTGDNIVEAGTLIAANDADSATGDGNITVNSGAVLAIGNGTSSGSVNGNVTNNGLVRFHTDSSGSYLTEISGSGSVEKIGSGVVTLQGESTYTGATNIKSGGLILNFVDNPLPTTTVVTLGDGTQSASLQIGRNSGLNQTVARLQTSGSGSDNKVIGGSATQLSRLTVNNASDFTYDGKLGGSTAANNNLALTKTGAGTLTLSGANTYTGGTIVSGGTLLANNASGSATGTGQVTVNADGTLGGTGSISANVVINNGGTLAPGASIESLNVGTVLSFNNGSIFSVEIDSSQPLNAAADLVVVNGSLNIGSTAMLELVDLGAVALSLDAKFTLISYTAGTWNGGMFAGYEDDTEFTLGANRYRIDYDDTTPGSNFGGGAGVGNNYVTISAVPEAGTVAMFAIAIAGAGIATKVESRRRHLRREQRAARRAEYL